MTPTGGVVTGGSSTVVTAESEPDEPDRLAALTEAVEAVRDEVAVLVAARRDDDERARAREQVIAHQRDELDALRSERRGGHLRPLVVGLQKLRADLLTEAARGEDAPVAPALLTSFADTVLDLLEGAGCHRVGVAVGDPVETGGQQIVRTEEVGPRGHGRVVAVVAEGWTETESGRVLAPARVVVGRHTAVSDGSDDGQGTHSPGREST